MFGDSLGPARVGAPTETRVTRPSHPADRGRTAQAFGLALALVLAILPGLSGAADAAGGPPGRWVAVGERWMHIVCTGTRAPGAPEVIFESGAFGFSADWAIVQQRLAADGERSCAYDRAGLGYSDPAPEPRDSEAIVADLEQLLPAAGEAGPYVLVGHSMAGLHMRLFADRNPSLIVGLVFVDCTTPEAVDTPGARADMESFMVGARAAKAAAAAGVMRWLDDAPFANKIGLTGEAEREKRGMFGRPAYNAAAEAEASQWPRSAAEARASGVLDPDWPVVVLTAGAVTGDLRDVQARPALNAARGYVEIVPGASHDDLLGPRHADEIVRAVRFVMNPDAAPPPHVTVAGGPAGGPYRR